MRNIVSEDTNIILNYRKTLRDKC